MSEPPVDPPPLSALRRAHQRVLSRDTSVTKPQISKPTLVYGTHPAAAAELPERDRGREVPPTGRQRRPAQPGVPVDPGPSDVFGARQTTVPAPQTAPVTAPPPAAAANVPREEIREHARRGHSTRKRAHQLPSVEVNRSLPSLPPLSPTSPTPQPSSPHPPPPPPPTFHQATNPRYDPTQPQPVTPTRPVGGREAWPVGNPEAWTTSPTPLSPTRNDPPYLGARHGQGARRGQLPPIQPFPRYAPVPSQSPNEKRLQSPYEKEGSDKSQGAAGANGSDGSKKSPRGSGQPVKKKSVGIMSLFEGAPPSPPLPPTDTSKTVAERLQHTINYADHIYETQVWLERFFSAGINGTILLQLLIAAAITILSSVPVNYSLATAILGAAATILAGLLARYRGTNQPERAGAHATAMRAFLNECDAFVEDYGDKTGSAYDAKIHELRTKLEIIMENAEKAQRGQMHPIQGSQTVTSTHLARAMV